MKTFPLKMGFCFLFILCHNFLLAQSPEYLEYFIGQDPGFGKGVVIPYDKSLEGNMTLNIDLNIVPEGLNLLHIRTKDINEKWSITHSKPFIKQSYSAENLLTKVEYFIDNDPGFGNGNSLNFTPNENSVMLFNIDLNNISDGIHLLNIRTKNFKGDWSITHIKPFFVRSHLFNNSIINKIEYFIGEDPGKGNGINLNLFPDPDLKTVFANFEIPLNMLSVGENLISARAKNSDGEWSYNYTVIKNYFPEVNILKLPDLEYPPQEVELQQSITHRYFQLAASDALNKLKGLHIKYYLNASPETILSSTISDKNGIIDLFISTGGSDINSNEDDILLPNSISEISIIGAYFNNIQVPININQIEPFSIKILESLKPTEVENGVSPIIEAELDYNIGKAVTSKTGEVIGKTGFGSVKVGLTVKPIFIISQKDSYDPNVYDFTYEGSAGVNAALKFNPFIKVNDSEISLKKTLGTKLEGKAKTSARVKIKHNSDLNSQKDLISLAYDFLDFFYFEMPDLLLAKNFIKRLSSYSKVPDLSVEVELNVGGGFESGMEINLGSDFLVTTSESETPINVKLSSDYESQIILGNSVEYNIKDNTVKLGASITAGVDAGINSELVLSPMKDAGSISIPIPRVVDNSKEYSYKMSKKVKRFKTNNLTGEFSSSTDEPINQTHSKVIYNNKFEIGKNLTQGIISFYRNSGASYTGNAFGDFLLTGDIPSVTVFNLYPNFNNFYKQYEDFIINAAYIQNTIPGNSELEHEIERDFVRKKNLIIKLELPLKGVEKEKIEFSISMDGWASFTYPYKKYKYSKSSNSLLVIKELPDNDNNIELPQDDPITEFWNNVKLVIEQNNNEILSEAYSFVTYEKDICSINRPTLLTNNKTPQKNLNADLISISKNKQSLDELPSGISFLIPQSPNSFEEGTEIKFSYFYPENSLSALVNSVDSFQIISDVFYLNAIINSEYLYVAPNGNYEILMEPSLLDLKRSSLPENSVIELLFLPIGSNTWEIIGQGNQLINFSKLGTFAYAVRIINDNEKPNIIVTLPNSLERYFEINIAENQSGINWKETIVQVNGENYNYIRNYTNNTFRVYLDSLLYTDTTALSLSINTRDFANNSNDTLLIYPCYSQLDILHFTSELNQLYKSRNTIQSANLIPSGNNILMQSQKDILLSPGFEVKNGKSFKAEIRSCEEP